MLLTIRQIDFGKQKVIKDYGFSQDGRRYRVQYRVEGANILINHIWRKLNWLYSIESQVWRQQRLKLNLLTERWFMAADQILCQN